MSCVCLSINRRAIVMDVVSLNESNARMGTCSVLPTSTCNYIRKEQKWLTAVLNRLEHHWSAGLGPAWCGAHTTVEHKSCLAWCTRPRISTHGGDDVKLD